MIIHIYIWFYRHIIRLLYTHMCTSSMVKQSRPFFAIYRFKQHPQLFDNGHKFEFPLNSKNVCVCVPSSSWRDICPHVGELYPNVFIYSGIKFLYVIFLLCWVVRPCRLIIWVTSPSFHWIDLDRNDHMLPGAQNSGKKVLGCSKMPLVPQWKLLRWEVSPVSAVGFK